MLQHFGNSDHNSLSFMVLMERYKVGPQVMFLNWEKAGFNSVREDLVSINWEQMLASK